MRDIVASIDCLIMSFRLSSTLLASPGFSNAEGGISSSGIGKRFLVDRSTPRDNTFGLLVQHRVKKSIKTRAKVIVSKTAGSMIVVYCSSTQDDHWL
jgi:hypothetical protein